MPRVAAVLVKSKAPGPFKSTKAERIDKMYAEAKVFSQHVEKVEKKIRNLQVATAGERLTGRGGKCSWHCATAWQTGWR